MFATLLQLYSATMNAPGGVRSPLPHLFGPPGCGKSSVVQDLGDMLGKNVHIINVSRISPLELEGVQMPNTDNTKLTLLTATFWTQLQEGDILLLDEFLRGFPEVYNGLLDILTSHEVGGFKLPKIFVVAASNSTVAYDSALEDRLLHIKVPDPRPANSTARQELKRRLVEEVGLHPDMLKDHTLSDDVVEKMILPTYDILDSIGKPNASASALEGKSLRHIVGLMKMRIVDSTRSPLVRMANRNNSIAMASKEYQYIIHLTDGRKTVTDMFDVDTLIELPNNEPFMNRLTELQRYNVQTNADLLEIHKTNLFDKMDSDGKETSDDELFYN